jgi:hypothetical protein
MTLWKIVALKTLKTVLLVAGRAPATNWHNRQSIRKNNVTNKLNHKHLALMEEYALPVAFILQHRSQRRKDFHEHTYLFLDISADNPGNGTYKRIRMG